MFQGLGAKPSVQSGEVKLDGLTPAQAGGRIAERLKKGQFLVDPQVSVSVLTLRSRQASALGQVAPTEGAAPSAAAPGPPAYPPSRAERAGPGEGGAQEALDLGSTVLPVLVRTYAKPVLAVVAAVVAVLLLRRLLR